MKHQHKIQFNGRLPLLITALSLTCVTGWYVHRLNAPPAASAKATQSDPPSKSKRSAASSDAMAARQAEATAVPVALWEAPTPMATPKLAAPAATDPSKPDVPQVDTAEGEEQVAKYRRATFDARSLASLTTGNELQKGDTVVLPLLDGKEVTGRVNLVQPDQNGWVRIGGELSGSEAGIFTLASDGEEVAAMILLEKKDLAYEVSGSVASNAVMREKPLSDAVCTPIAQSGAEQVLAVQQAPSQPQAIPPILSSRPSATAVAYLDFDGETVTDPVWNGGNTIVAAPSALTNAQITQVWQRVSEDFAPFDIDITTDVSRYNNAPVGKRMRCIITPTNTAQPGSGGVAYVNSFSGAGRGYSSTVPCWVFNGGVNAGSESISHELGHTLGLRHDGTASIGYYSGHGSGVTSWGPIMGTSFDKSVTQWSKGEYTGANNQEDDIAIISNSTNGFGFIGDETGDTPATSAALNAPGGTVNQSGVITRSTDVDSYVINVQAGTVNVTATPFTFYPNLDILLELQDAAGTVIATANPDLALNASINQTVSAGVYYVKVRGTGRGDVLGTGYSSYGSIGQYTLSGTLPSGSVQLAPVITSASSASGVQGQPFSYQITATNTPTSYTASGLPAGLTLNTTSGLISGTPTAEGASNISLGASNAAGTGQGSLALTVTSSTNTGGSNATAIAIADLQTNTSTVNVSGVSGTVTQVKVKLDGLTHTWPDDIDVVLVGPGGQKVMLMSDAGGDRPVNNAVLTFSDAGTSALPDATQIVTGTYKPGNSGGSETLPSPAPVGPYGTSLAVFNGLNPNGAWRLYVADDANADIGSIARGWSIEFTTAASLVRQGSVQWSQPDGSAIRWHVDGREQYTGNYTVVNPAEAAAEEE